MAWLEPGETTGSPPDPGLGLPGGWRVAGLLPLLAGIEPLGILALTWADDLPPAVRRQSELVATGVAGAMARVLREGVALPDGHRRGIGDGPTQPPPPEGTTATGHAGAADPTLAVLDVLLHPMLVCRPVRDEEGGVGDLRVEHANPATRDPAGRGADQLIGRRFLDLYPGAAQDGLLAACRRVLRTGEPADLPGHPWAVTVRGRSIVAPTHLRITRYRDGVLVTWIPGRPTRLPKTDRGWVRHDR